MNKIFFLILLCCACFSINAQDLVPIKSTKIKMKIYAGWAELGVNEMFKNSVSLFDSKVQSKSVYNEAPEDRIKLAIFYPTFIRKDTLKNNSLLKYKQNFNSDFVIPKEKLYEENFILENGTNGILFFYIYTNLENMIDVFTCELLLEPKNKPGIILRNSITIENIPDLALPDFPKWSNYFKKVLITIE